MKYQLANGCSHSQLSVSPKNWQTKSAKITSDWFITYRFYDLKQIKPKQVMIKGMNVFKSLKERQAKTNELLEQEIQKLQEGFNPFEKASEVMKANQPEMGLLDALQFAFENASVSEVTKKDLNYALTLFGKAARYLRYEHLLISIASRKHYKLLIEKASNSPDRFNKNRSYLMILLSVLTELEIIEYNPVRDISKKKVIKTIRQTLSLEERKKVNCHLQLHYPTFHRFLHIFYHSGARISELINVREQDVELAKQRFKVTIKKGKVYREVWKVIKDVALPFWESALNEAEKGQYIFSKDLKAGDNPIKPYQINKRWYKLVKKKLGITADFYSLKHLHTTEVVDMISDKEAAKHNSHTSTAMVNQVYDVNNKERTNVSVKSLSNSFA